jgi:WD40 repeat protein
VDSVQPTSSNLSDDGRLLAIARAVPNSAGSDASEVVVWDVDSGRELGVLQADGSKPGYDAAAVNGPQALLAVALSNGTIEIRDLKGFHLRQTIHAYDSSDVIRQLQFSPDGSRLIAVASFSMGRQPIPVRIVHAGLSALGREREFKMIVLDVATGKRLGYIENEARSVFSVDGRTLATTTTDGTARLRTLPAK